MQRQGRNLRNLVEFLYRKGIPQATIARDLGVSRQRIHQLVKGYTNGLAASIKHRNSWALELDKKLFERSKGKCERCHLRGGRIMHHKNLKENDHRLENLIYLCPTCHYQIHSAYRRYQQKYKRELERDLALFKPWIVRY